MNLFSRRKTNMILDAILTLLIYLFGLFVLIGGIYSMEEKF